MSQWPFYDTDTYTRVYTLHGTLGYHCKCESMVALIVKPAKSKEEDKGKDKEKDKQKYEHWCELLIIKPRWQSSVAVAVRILLPPSCSCNQSLQLTSAGVVRFLICSVLFQYFLWICIFAFVFITAVAVRILLSPPALTINPQTDQYLIVSVFQYFFVDLWCISIRVCPPAVAIKSSDWPEKYSSCVMALLCPPRLATYPNVIKQRCCSQQ